MVKMPSKLLEDNYCVKYTVASEDRGPTPVTPEQVCVFFNPHPVSQIICMNSEQTPPGPNHAASARILRSPTATSDQCLEPSRSNSEVR